MPIMSKTRARSLPYVCLAFALSLAWLSFLGLGCNKRKTSAAGPGEYLFCFWNVENLFDDRFDGRSGPGDKEHDAWQAKHPEILKLKLSKLTDALLELNGGKGPDILAICEVESIRAAELLKQSLNDRLADPALHYQTLLMKEVAGGRHIAPAILSRLPGSADRTRTHGNRLRILEGHLKVDGHELIILASHWTSRVRDGSDEGRASYGDKIYGAVNAICKRNPTADVLICGDFNDAPEDESVTSHLHASGDRKLVREAKDPLVLFNLMAGKDPIRFGTHYYSGWLIFDQIVVSPGMLDENAWSCLADSVETVRGLTRPGDRIGRPWRFGSEKETAPRGYSDHFPVTVKLKLSK